MQPEDPVRGREGARAPTGKTGNTAPGIVGDSRELADLHGLTSEASSPSGGFPKPPWGSWVLQGGSRHPLTAVILIVTRKGRKLKSAEGQVSFAVAPWSQDTLGFCTDAAAFREHGPPGKPTLAWCPELLQGLRDTARLVDGLPVWLHSVPRSRGAGSQPSPLPIVTQLLFLAWPASALWSSGASVLNRSPPSI